MSRAVTGPAVPAARWRRVLGVVGGVVLGVVLLVAVAGKVLDPEAFGEQVRAEGLEIVLSAGWVAVFALALEAGLGVALLFGLRNRAVLLATTALVLLFLFLTGRAAWRDLQGLPPLDSSGCGCFGPLLERSPREAFLQDFFLLVPGLALAWVGAGRPARWRAVALAAAGTAVGVAGLALASPQLPLDDVATSLRPGVELAGLCAGQGAERLCLDQVVPELATGRHLVVIADTEDPGFAARVPVLNAYGERGDEPLLTLLADLPPGSESRLLFEWAPAFALASAPSALLDPLHRRLPRSFVVEEGRVTSTYSGLPSWLTEPGAAVAGEVVP
ncbi:MAG: hypothetical protein M5U13_01730 [Thermoanaerobaculia bacterium]|nr:hypothetical protein [Thermoanaerobaculia bacterium]